MLHSLRKKQNQIHNRRTFFLLCAKLGIFSVIGWRFFDIQILNSEKYKTLSKKNQIKIEIIYPIRGKIRDRNDYLLATNKKVFDLYIIPEQSDNLEETLNNLNYFVNFDFKKKRQVIELSKKVKKFEKIKVLENLDWQKLELIETNKNHLSGLYLVEDYQRIYPQKKSFSHVVGYISKQSQSDLNLPYISKMPQLNIGRTGFEKYFNEKLIGKAGQREIEVNAKGRIIREIAKKIGEKGQDINLTIDYRIQEFCHNILGQHKAGSIVVLNTNSGEILAMTSMPSFDPNLIVTKPNIDYWQSIISNSLSPLTDRSIQGLYAPGSTFKMIVALAGLKYDIINPNTTALCSGKIEFGDRFYHCWKTTGHGKMDVEKAIKESCDVFFYELSKKIGINKIADLAKEFGLGQSLLGDIENEANGIVPSKKWKREKLNESWYAGETLNAGIGQGYTLCTPLQLAVMTARIASNGKKIKPILFKSKAIIDFKEIHNISNHIPLVKKAMFKVVNEQGGTAYRHKSNKYSFSGKTGTSQVKKITLDERESEDFRKKEILWKNKDHALFIGYMPSDNPRYAISVVIEHGGSGSATAAPIAKKTFDFINQLNI